MGALYLVAKIYQTHMYIYLCIYIYIYIYIKIYIYICIQCHSQTYFSIIESEQVPKHFQDRALSKDLRPFWKVHFKPIQILYIIKDFLTAPKTIVGTFQFHIVDTCSCLKKNSEYNKLGGIEVPFKDDSSGQKRRCLKLDYKSTACYNES